MVKSSIGEDLTKNLSARLVIETNYLTDTFYVVLAYFRIGKLYRCLAMPKPTNFVSENKVN